jgi:hypothetical protein
MPKKITARKFGVDDQRSWAIFVEGQSFPVVAGLEKSEVPYYKRMTEKILKEKGENI